MLSKLTHTRNISWSGGTTRVNQTPISLKLRVAGVSPTKHVTSVKKTDVEWQDEECPRNIPRGMQTRFLPLKKESHISSLKLPGDSIIIQTRHTSNKERRTLILIVLIITHILTCKMSNNNERSVTLGTAPTTGDSPKTDNSTKSQKLSNRTKKHGEPPLGIWHPPLHTSRELSPNCQEKH